MTPGIGLTALLGAVAVLTATNPDEAQFIDWTADQVIEERLKDPESSHPWRTIVELAALPAMVETHADRDDCGLFSVYRGKGAWEGVVVLGIAGHFIRIERDSPP